MEPSQTVLYVVWGMLAISALCSIVVEFTEYRNGSSAFRAVMGETATGVVIIVGLWVYPQNLLFLTCLIVWYGIYKFYKWMCAKAKAMRGLF